jgi:hypothetical protein
MKKFREFIFDCYFKEYKSTQELIAEVKSKRGGPDYDYEQSFVNLYNHMVNKSDSEGADMRKLFRGAVQRGDMFTITDLIAKEVQRAQTDPTSPLYFDNLNPNDAGFTGGKRSKSGEVQDKEAHREAYYNKLLNQQYSLLNFVQSESGKIQASRGHIAEREGATKIALTDKAREITGKEQDTSKVDVSFVDENGKKYGISLKDAKGAVVNSSGAEETKAYILLGMNSLLDQQEKVDKIITPEQRAEREAMGKELANQLALYMSSTRGMSKEQQKDALPQMQEYLNSIESVIPGTIQAMSREAITGKGKYGDASTVDALFSTGRGGEVIEDPSWLAQYVFQRGRLGKGTSKTKEGAIQRPTTMSGDIKNYQDAEDKPTDSEYLKKWREEWGVPAWEKKIANFEPEIQDEIRNLQSKGEFDLKDLVDFETFDIRAKKVREIKQQEQQAQAEAEAQHTQTAAELEQQVAQSQLDMQTAQTEVDKANDPTKLRYSDGTRPLLQNLPRFQSFIDRNQSDPSVKKIVQKREAAQNNLAATQAAANDTVAAYQTHLSTPPTATLDTIRQGAAKAQGGEEQQVSTQTQKPEPTQQPKPEVQPEPTQQPKPEVQPEPTQKPEPTQQPKPEVQPKPTQQQSKPNQKKKPQKQPAEGAPEEQQ